METDNPIGDDEMYGLGSVFIGTPGTGVAPHVVETCSNFMTAQVRWIIMGVKLYIFAMSWKIVEWMISATSSSDWSTSYHSLTRLNSVAHISFWNKVGISVIQLGSHNVYILRPVQLSIVPVSTLFLFLLYWVLRLCSKAVCWAVNCTTACLVKYRWYCLSLGSVLFWLHTYFT